MPLQGHRSLCQEKQKIIVSQDEGNRRKHIAHNTNAASVTQYRVDGEVITEGLRCDFLLLNEDAMVAYFIELKGSDLSHAVKQLESTEIKLKGFLGGYDCRFRIVCSKSRTHEISGTAYKKFQMAKKGKLLCRQNVIEEEI